MCSTQNHEEKEKINPTPSQQDIHVNALTRQCVVNFDAHLATQKFCEYPTAFPNEKRFKQCIIYY